MTDDKPEPAAAGDSKKRYLEALDRKMARSSAPGAGGGPVSGNGQGDTHGRPQKSFRRRSGGG